jgi:hypothetical protein
VEKRRAGMGVGNSNALSFRAESRNLLLARGTDL